MEAQIRKPLLTVVVCTYNRADLLLHCLQSLSNQTLDNSRYEVIVVDNNSMDSSAQIAESFCRCNRNYRWMVEPNQGLSYARNRGWREATGDYVAYIDDDAKAAPTWCEKILNAFQSVQPKPAAVGGEIHPWYETPLPRWFTDDLEVRTWGDISRFLAPPGAVYGFSGSNMAFPRKCLEENGGFSPHYGMVGDRVRMGDDTEFFMRIYERHPWFWYDPSLRVYHYVSARSIRISYRFWRSYKCGESHAHMKGRRLLSMSYLRSLLAFGLLLAKAPFRVISASSNRGAALVRVIQDVGYQVGYLTSKL